MPQRNHRKGRLLWGHGSAKCGFGFEGGAFSSRVIVLALALWLGFLGHWCELKTRCTGSSFRVRLRVVLSVHGVSSLETGAWGWQREHED